jgi:hypothetical protein
MSVRRLMRKPARGFRIDPVCRENASDAHQIGAFRARHIGDKIVHDLSGFLQRRAEQARSNVESGIIRGTPVPEIDGQHFSRLMQCLSIDSG